MPGNHRDALGLADREFHRILLVKPSSLGDIIHYVARIERAAFSLSECAHLLVGGQTVCLPY